MKAGGSIAGHGNGESIVSRGTALTSPREIQPNTVSVLAYNNWYECPGEHTILPRDNIQVELDVLFPLAPTGILTAYHLHPTVERWARSY